MRTRTATTLAAAFLVIAPAAFAQRGQTGGQRPAQASGERAPQADGERQPQFVVQRAPVRPNLPSSPILPMTNPVAPITNPVQPVIRYGGPGGTPTVVIPTTTPQDRQGDRRSDDRRDRGRDRDVPVVILGGPYVDPYYYPPYYNQPVVAPSPVPGQLPNTYTYSPQPIPVLYAVPVAPPSSYAGGAAVVEEPTVTSEPRMIITPPEPERVVEPPAIGTPRAELLLRYGQPWGSIATQGRETLYFRNLTLVLEGGKVSQIR